MTVMEEFGVTGTVGVVILVFLAVFWLVFFTVAAVAAFGPVREEPRRPVKPADPFVEIVAGLRDVDRKAPGIVREVRREQRKKAAR